MPLEELDNNPATINIPLTEPGKLATLNIPYMEQGELVLLTTRNNPQMELGNPATPLSHTLSRVEPVYEQHSHCLLAQPGESCTVLLWQQL